MSPLITNIRKHPLAWFYAISILLTICSIPLFIFTGAQEAIDVAFTTTGAPFNTDLVTWARLVAAYPAAFGGAMIALLQVAAPDIAVIIVVVSASGWRGLRDLKRRFRFWSADTAWKSGLRAWIICVLTFAAMSMTTAGLSQFILPVQGFVWNVNPLSLHFALGLLTAMFLDGGAVFEENGWRGFALPLLLERFHPLVASTMLGLLWAFWHMPVKFDLALTYGFTNFLLMFSVLTVKFVLLSIIMTYFWGSVGQTTIIAIVMHGLSNDSVRLGGEVLSEAFADQLHYELNLVVPMVVVAITLLVVTRGQLGLRSTIAVRQQRGLRFMST